MNTTSKKTMNNTPAKSSAKTSKHGKLSPATQPSKPTPPATAANKKKNYRAAKMTEAKKNTAPATPTIAEKKLYVFKNRELQTLSLTHASSGGEDNERLEWLGDALLDFIIGNILFARYPKISEGSLTQARATLVSGKTLSELARKIGLPAQLRMSANESRNGGRARDSILAGAFESYMAAVYLDGGMQAAENLATYLFTDLLTQVDQIVQAGGGMLKDGKTRLQEYLQKHARPLPQYNILTRGAIARRPYCVAECRLSDSDSAVVAVASNRREAEQLAGCCLLATLSA